MSQVVKHFSLPFFISFLFPGFQQLLPEEPKLLRISFVIKPCYIICFLYALPPLSSFVSFFKKAEIHVMKKNKMVYRNCLDPGDHPHCNTCSVLHLVLPFIRKSKFSADLKNVTFIFQSGICTRKLKIYICFSYEHKC